ncbi:Mobilization protein A [Dyella sp. AD56]|uniref:MobA/MobL family protein n=1 Tax=Dyella sp. AD56 TaxID=1528744 RepID=UPI000CBD068A|nr:MobA/MobL family protein [Dyella sp. AD56]PMQ06541.1 Mobilization protein A [Dyella sp. AD56]
MSQHARPHLETHNRAKGHSAVAGAAYRLGLRLYDPLDNQWHDYTRRAIGEEIVRATTIAPAGAPAWATDPQILWVRVRQAEKRRDAQEARDFRIPIPFGLSDKQAGDLAEEMAQFIVRELHTPVSMGLHRDASVDALGNTKPSHKVGFHAHLYFPTRRLEPTTEDGGSSMWVLGSKLTMLSNKNTSGAYVERLNQHWATLANRYLAESGGVPDVDHRSYVRAGVRLTPQPTLGAKVVALERDGFFTRQGDAVRDILVMSEVYKKAHAATLSAQHAQAMADVAKAAYSEDANGTPAMVVAESEPRIAAPKDSLDSGSLATRFRTSIGTTGTEDEQRTHREAVSLVRVIQSALRALERLGAALLRFAKDRERERAEILGLEHELASQREQRADSYQRLKTWEAAHPWRIAVAKACGGDAAQMPEEWRRLRTEARTHHAEVQALKATLRGHQRAIEALAEDEAPLTVQQEVQEGRLRSVVKALAELGAGYAAQLVAVCREDERVALEKVLPHTEEAAGEDDLTLDATPPTLRSSPRVGL